MPSLFRLSVLFLLLGAALAQIVDPDPILNPTQPKSNTASFSLVAGRNFLDAVQASFTSTLYEVALLDTFDCVNAGLAIYDNLYGSFNALLTLNFVNALVEVGLAVHKSALVYKTCYQVYTDLGRFLTLYTRIQVPAVFAADLALNSVLNFIDIYMEVVAAVTGMQADDYAKMGIYTGKILSDVVLKNPTDVDWTPNNSEVFTQLVKQKLLIQDQISGGYDVVPALTSGMDEWELRQAMSEARLRLEAELI